MPKKPNVTKEFDVEVVTDGTIPGIAEYARRKIGELGRFSHQPVLYARVRLTRLPDPAVALPMIAQANIDVSGQLVRAQAAADTARNAVDRVESRLRRQLEHLARHRPARGGSTSVGDSHEWRHRSKAAHRAAYFPRPVGDRRIIRRKSFTLEQRTVDEAAYEMDLLDYDFHLFTEAGTGQDSVLYRVGPSGYRLAQLTPVPRTQLAAFDLPVTLSTQPAPRLTADQAAERLNLLGLPFVFFVDTRSRRGNVLYHRYDGHYGLITPVIPKPSSPSAVRANP